jgi:hypothetical protein
LPVVAPVGTVAVTDVAVLGVNVAVTPLNLTPVTPVRFVPVIVTLVPGLPLAGVNDVIVGAAPTPKLVALVAAGRTGVVTWIGPEVAPVGTVAVIDVPDTTFIVVAAVALNWTCVAPQKFVPVMVTTVPTGPPVGRNDVIVGATAAETLKSSSVPLSDDAVPLLTTTLPAPVVAAHGTVAVIEVSEPIVNVAAAPPIVTPVVEGLLKLVPVMDTTVPRAPADGDTPVTLGCRAQAGKAVMSTPTTPITRASAVARPEAFLSWNRKSGSPLLATRESIDGRHVPDPSTAVRWFHSRGDCNYPTRCS